MVLLSNTQANVISLEGYDLEITGRRPLDGKGAVSDGDTSAKTTAKDKSGKAKTKSNASKETAQ